MKALYFIIFTCLIASCSIHNDNARHMIELHKAGELNTSNAEHAQYVIVQDTIGFDTDFDLDGSKYSQFEKRLNAQWEARALETCKKGIKERLAIYNHTVGIDESTSSAFDKYVIEGLVICNDTNLV